MLSDYICHMAMNYFLKMSIAINHLDAELVLPFNPAHRPRSVTLVR